MLALNTGLKRSLKESAKSNMTDLNCLPFLDEYIYKLASDGVTRKGGWGELRKISFNFL